MSELLRARPTHWQFRAIDHLGKQLTALSAPEGTHEIEIDHMRTMNAQKAFAIEPKLESRE